MRKALQRARLLLATPILLLVLCGGALAQYQVPVSGVVRNATNLPVPGVAVSLVHPVFGRSAPSFTDQFGQYTFWNIPRHPAPYFLEIYWGQQLIYRQQLYVNGPMQWNVFLR